MAGTCPAHSATLFSDTPVTRFALGNPNTPPVPTIPGDGSNSIRFDFGTFDALPPTAPVFVDIVFNPGRYQLSGNPFRDVGAKRLVGTCGRYVAQLRALRPRTSTERGD